MICMYTGTNVQMFYFDQLLNERAMPHSYNYIHDKNQNTWEHKEVMSFSILVMNDTSLESLRVTFNIIRNQVQEWTLFATPRENVICTFWLYSFIELLWTLFVGSLFLKDTNYKEDMQKTTYENMGLHFYFWKNITISFKNIIN